MAKKIILSIAMSLDGYILDDQDQYDWIVGDGTTGLDTDKAQSFSFDTFLDAVDIIVMGRRSFDRHGSDFPNHKVVVATNRPLNATLSASQIGDNCFPIGGDLVAAVQQMARYEFDDLPEGKPDKASEGKASDVKASEGKAIWIFGGAEVVAQFLAANAIDHYIIGIIPIILGGGKSLFQGGFQRIPLTLSKISAEGGIVILEYKPR